MSVKKSAYESIYCQVKYDMTRHRSLTRAQRDVFDCPRAPQTMCIEDKKKGSILKYTYTAMPKENQVKSIRVRSKKDIFKPYEIVLIYCIFCDVWHEKDYCNKTLHISN